MTCSCGHEFCWYCLKNYHNVANSQYEQHNQKDCLFLLLTKIITLILFMLSILLVTNGNENFNWMMQKAWSTIIIIIRALLTDGALVGEVIVLNRMNHAFHPFRKILAIFLMFDLVIGLLLWFIGEMAYTLLIIGLSTGVALMGLGIGLIVDFSVATWFNYIM
jgi:hypothetical protein